jgi:tetratricopeptide (TPR) repeat protein
MMCEFDKAKTTLEKARLAKPMTGTSDGNYTDALLNLGLLEYHRENDDLAIDYYRAGLNEIIDFDLVFNYAHARLRQYCSGKYDDLKYAWQLYESRFRIRDAVKLSSGVNWVGGYVDSITVLSEQGLGDCIMFSRYLDELSKYCNRLVIQCEESANAIFSKYNVSNSTEITTTHTVAFGSLGNLLDYVPKCSAKGYNSGNVIACVWQSNNKHSNNRLRNTSVEYMLKLGNVASIGPDCSDPRIPHLASSTWNETIASLRNVRCVVTIDSAIAHLCGMLGVECYVLMPLYNSDFRWGDSSTGYNNIWYDSVKVIRNPGSWDAAFGDLRNCLKLADQT